MLLPLNTMSLSIEEVECWGVQVLRTSVRMPTANPHCERMMGTIRRECLDYVIPFNASQLRRTLREWASHYNTGRPHRFLGPGISDQMHHQTVPYKPTRKPPRASRVIAKSL